MDQESSAEKKVNANPQEQKHDPNSFIIMFLGKIFLFIIIASLFTGAGFYLGRYTILFKSHSPVQVDNSKNSLPESLTETPVIPSPEKEEKLPEPTPTPSQQQTIDIKAQGQSFSLLAPMGWQSVVETENYTTRSKISKDGYSLIVMINMATEGAPCGFKDSPLSPSEMFPDVSEFTYDNYKEFKGSNNKLLRRAFVSANLSENKSYFVICQKRDADWSRPADFGFISYELPYSPTPETAYKDQLSILDSMVSSMKPL